MQNSLLIISVTLQIKIFSHNKLYYYAQLVVGRKILFGLAALISLKVNYEQAGKSLPKDIINGTAIQIYITN